MKKAFIPVIWIIMLFSLATSSLCENGSDGIMSGDFYYKLFPDGTAEICGYYGNLGEMEAFFDDSFSADYITDLIIPSELDGHPVTSIGEEAFTQTEKLSNVFISEGIVNISDEAFCFCDDLASISLPESISSIGASPFLGCDNLREISVSDRSSFLACHNGALFSKPDKRLVYYPSSYTAKSFAIPNGTVIIGDSAFYECDQLKSISIPNTVSIIGVDAFGGCSTLEDISIPEGVTDLGAFAFWECKNLKEITVPVTTINVGANPFVGCKRLKLGIAKDHPTLGLKGGVLFSKPDKRLISYPCSKEVETYEIPQGTEIIDDAAFTYCTIKKIVIPDSVKRIGNMVFDEVNKLETVVVPGSVTEIEDDAFVTPFTGGNMILIVEPGSYAEKYCKRIGLEYQY